MSEYTDFWKSLDLPADQSPKTQAFNTVASNADRLNLTDAEQYSLGWGPDALPEDWVKARAKEINDQIQAAESTAILKRGLSRSDKSQEELDAEAAAKALEEAKAKEAVNTPGAPRVDNSGGDGQSPSGSPETSAVDTMGIESRFSFDGFNTDAAKAGLAVAGLPGAAIGGLLGGVGRESFSNQQTVDDFDMANFGITGAQLDSDRANAVSNTPAAQAQMDAQARENEANRGGSDGPSSSGMGGATEGSAGSTAATSDSPDGPDGNNAGQSSGNDGGGGGDTGGGTNSDGGTGDTGSDGSGGGGTGDGDSD